MDAREGSLASDKEEEVFPGVLTVAGLTEYCFKRTDAPYKESQDDASSGGAEAKKWCRGPSETVPPKSRGSSGEVPRALEGTAQPGGLASPAACVRCSRLERGLYLQRVRLACVAKESKEILQCMARELRTERQRTREAEASLGERDKIIQQLRESVRAAEEKLREREREVTQRLAEREAELQKKGQELRRREQESEEVRQRLKQMEDAISALGQELKKSFPGKESRPVEVCCDSQDLGSGATQANSEGKPPGDGSALVTQRAEQAESGSTVSDVRDPGGDSPVALDRVVVRLDRLERLLLLEEKQLGRQVGALGSSAAEKPGPGLAESDSRKKEKFPTHDQGVAWEARVTSASELCTISINEVPTSREESGLTLLADREGDVCPVQRNSERQVGGAPTQAETTKGLPSGHSTLQERAGRSAIARQLPSPSLCHRACKLEADSGAAETVGALPQLYVGNAGNLDREDHENGLGRAPSCSSSTAVCRARGGLLPHGAAGEGLAGGLVSPRDGEPQNGLRRVPEVVALQLLSSDQQLTEPHRSAEFVVACFHDSLQPRRKKEIPSSESVPRDERCQPCPTTCQRSQASPSRFWHMGQRSTWAPPSASAPPALLIQQYGTESCGLPGYSDMVSWMKRYSGVNEGGAAGTKTCSWRTPRGVCSLLSQATVARGAFACTASGGSPAVSGSSCGPWVLPGLVSQSTGSSPSLSTMHTTASLAPWDPRLCVSEGSEQRNSIGEFQNLGVLLSAYSSESKTGDTSEERPLPDSDNTAPYGLACPQVREQTELAAAKFRRRAERISPNSVEKQFSRSSAAEKRRELSDGGAGLLGRETLPVTEMECEYYCSLERTVLPQESEPCASSPSAAASVRHARLLPRPSSLHSHAGVSAASSASKGDGIAGVIRSGVVAEKRDNSPQGASCAENREPYQRKPRGGTQTAPHALRRQESVGVSPPRQYVLAKGSALSVATVIEPGPCAREGTTSPIASHSGQAVQGDAEDPHMPERFIGSPHAAGAMTAMNSDDFSRGKPTMSTIPRVQDCERTSVPSPQAKAGMLCGTATVVGPSVIGPGACGGEERKGAPEKGGGGQIMAISHTKLPARELPTDALDFSSTDSDCSDPWSYGLANDKLSYWWC